MRKMVLFSQESGGNNADMAATGFDSSQNTCNEQMKTEINNMTQLFQQLSLECGDLDRSLDLMKEKYAQESIRLKNRIKSNNNMILSFRNSSKAIVTGSPLNANQNLQIEIDQLTEEIQKLKSNEKNLSISQKLIQSDYEELEFLINAVPFSHEDIFKLAEQKIAHQVNKSIVEHQILFAEAKSEKESLEIELKMANDIITNWSKENFKKQNMINELKRQRRVIRQALLECNNNGINYDNTIPVSDLQKRLEIKEKEKQEEILEIEVEFGPKFKRLKSQIKISQSEIDDRLKAIEELNQKHNELVMEYGKCKEAHINQIKILQKIQSDELSDIKFRGDREIQKELKNQRLQFESNNLVLY